MGVYLPFAESWFAGTLWGLRWESPAFMAQLRHYLTLVKLVLVGGALYLLSVKRELVRGAIPNSLLEKLFSFSAYALGALQIVLLCSGFLFSVLFSSNQDAIHQEKTFQDRTIYVYNSDPGTFGQAYHTFYLKCPKSYNRYELSKIARINWMRDYSFDVIDNELIIDDRSEEDFHESQSQRIELSNFSC